MASDVPVFVVCRDRISCLASLVGWLEAARHERIVLVDNDSSYPPLLEYLAASPHTVVRLKTNVGHLAPWEAELIDRYAGDGPYVVTDPDVVPAEACPIDAVARLVDLLGRYPDFCKAGLGLMIDDIPECYSLREYVLKWEQQHWESTVEPEVFVANVDTTFAAYRPHSTFAKKPALRTGAPYVARHLPWYLDSANLSEEERYYRSHASATINTWNQERLPPKLDGVFHRSPWARARRRLRAFNLGRRGC